MRPDFSEFSYGYALTESIIRQAGGTTTAPIFPSLYEEGQTGGGYDVKIQMGTPLFLQFKLSHFFSNGRAKQYSHFNHPYYRFNIMPDKISKQHQMLIDWEKSGEEVFYISPEFHKNDQFNSFYANGTIIENSAAFSPIDIGEINDQENHVVCYRRKDNHGFFFSEPTKIKKYRLEDRFENIRSKKKGRKIDKNYFEELNHELLNLIEKTEEKIKRKKYKRKEEIDPLYILDTFASYNAEKPAKKHRSLGYREKSREEIFQTLKEGPPEHSVDIITKVFLGVQLVFLKEE